MPFEWDERKDEANQQKPGFSFVAASAVFDDPRHVKVDSSKPEHGEIRQRAIGVVKGQLITVIFTMRPTGTRIISARRARSDERAQYDQDTTRT